MNASITNLSEFSPRGVASLEPKLRGNVRLNPVEKLMVYQALSRQWRNVLTITQFCVLSYIVDRTVGWGLGYFSACADNVLHGAAGYSGVGVGRSSYYRALNDLVALGAISRESKRDRTKITVHVDWYERGTY